MAGPTRITVAVPLYNEEAVLPELLTRLRGALDELPGGPHEIVLVDDGSRDRTAGMLAAAAEEDPRIVAVFLSRNFGQQAAFCAALDHATGDAVVLMDGDLQDEPEAIPRLLERFEQGYDVVYAVRVGRKENLVLRACYAIFYRLLAFMSGTELPRDAGDFSMISRRVVDELRRTPERHRYLRGLRAWVGFRQSGVEVERAARASGRPKYTIRRLLRLALDGIFSFSVAPLRLAAGLGAVAVLLSLAVAGYALYGKFVQGSPQGFTALIVSITFFAGVQLIFLGVIGEYVGRIFEQVKGRPLYIVEKIAGSPQTWTQTTPERTESSSSDTGGGGPARP